MMLVVRGCGVGCRSRTGRGGLNLGHAGGVDEAVDEAGCDTGCADFGGTLEAFGFGILVEGILRLSVCDL